MPYSIHIADTTHYLLVTVTGSLAGAKDLADYAKTILDEMIRRNQTRLLLDETRLETAFDAHDAVSLAETLDMLNVAGLGLRAAIVYAPENSEATRALETALRNRAMSYRAFEVEHEAESWLLG
jgi:hypothetical protein